MLSTGTLNTDKEKLVLALVIQFEHVFPHWVSEGAKDCAVHLLIMSMFSENIDVKLGGNKIMGNKN